MNKENYITGSRPQVKPPYSGLSVVQNGIASYAIFLPTGQQIGLVAMPPNRQYVKDAQALATICRVLAERWSNP